MLQEHELRRGRFGGGRQSWRWVRRAGAPWCGAVPSPARIDHRAGGRPVQLAAMAAATDDSISTALPLPDSHGRLGLPKWP